jgi:hypothetical protein
MQYFAFRTGAQMPVFFLVEKLYEKRRVYLFISYLKRNKIQEAARKHRCKTQWKKSL